jgi:GNAT superfamily N-acetyltransferase
MSEPRALDLRELDATGVRAAGGDLAAVLADCVAGGASVSFMAPYSLEDAQTFFNEVADAVERGRIVLLAAFDEGRAVGTVQLNVATPPNQPHRADVNKLLVHRAARGRGVGEALMRAVEGAALARGRTLLVLDTASDAAERLYERLGWSRAGTVPGYALLPDGTPCATTFFWKRLGS